MEVALENPPETVGQTTRRRGTLPSLAGDNLQGTFKRFQNLNHANPLRGSGEKVSSLFTPPSGQKMGSAKVQSDLFQKSLREVKSFGNFRKRLGLSTGLASQISHQKEPVVSARSKQLWHPDLIPTKLVQINQMTYILGASD